MLTFFRKIRRSLLQGGNMRRYLLYAVGEILLVMIGILLALQVNNWNSIREAKRTLESNLGYLVEDLANDKAQIYELRDIRVYVHKSCSEFINSYKSSTPIPQSLWNESFFEIVIERYFKGNESGFEKVENSVLFESEKISTIRNLMREYKVQTEQLSFTESKLNVTIEEVERALFQIGFQDEIWDYVRVFFMDFAQFTAPEEELNALEIINKYEQVKGIFLRYEVDVPIILWQYEELVKKGELLRMEVEKYLQH